MRVLVAGVGGIGGWIAGTLAKGGAEVALFARGATLARLQSNGLTLLEDGRRDVFALPALDTASGPYDVIFVCAKTQDFAAICAGLAPVLQTGVEVVAAVNGLPWWFLDGEGIRLESIDPGASIAERLRDVTPLGGVLHASTHAIEPGVIRIVKADRLILGEAPGRPSHHLPGLSDALQRGGVSAPAVANIREEIWAKLWGNMNMNPLSALTRLTSLPILERPELRRLVHDMMTEFDAIGQKLGLALPMSADERIEVTRKLGDFRTSMLADALASRRLEHEGILGCVVELAEKLDVEAPVSRVVHALLKGLDLSFTRGS